MSERQDHTHWDDLNEEDREEPYEIADTVIAMFEPTLTAQREEIEEYRRDLAVLAQFVECERVLREHQERCRWSALGVPKLCDGGCIEFSDARESAYRQAVAILPGGVARG